MVDKLKEGGKALDINNMAFNAMESVTRTEDVNIASDVDHFKEYKKRWHDPSLREQHSKNIQSLTAKYLTKPAGFAGFIEESESMRADVMSASKETGVEPTFLYNVAMQEGMARKISILHGANIKNAKDKSMGIVNWLSNQEKAKLYESERAMDTYLDVGMDALFEEQPLAVKRGYLEKPIQAQEGQEFLRKESNEKNMIARAGHIESKDVWRGVGALLQLNRDYMKSHFEKQGLDFDILTPEQKNFWTYASYNAGQGTAGKLLEEHGIDPFAENLLRHEIFAGQQKGYVGKQYGKTFWMFNVGRVMGGTEASKPFTPFTNK